MDYGAADRAVRQCQINALKISNPSIEETPKTPRSTYALGDGYLLLAAKEAKASPIPHAENEAIRRFLLSNRIREIHEQYEVNRWARLQLPNGQIARSRWKEEATARKSIRISRNVKVSYHLYAIDPSE
jgi:hypothetical protein